MAIVPFLPLIVRPHDYLSGVSMTLLYSCDIIYLRFIDFVKPRNFSILQEKCSRLLQLDHSSSNKDVQDLNIPHPPQLSKFSIKKKKNSYLIHYGRSHYKFNQRNALLFGQRSFSKQLIMLSLSLRGSLCRNYVFSSMLQPTQQLQFKKQVFLNYQNLQVVKIQ